MTEINFAGLTDQGHVRQRNEDHWCADPQLGLFIVSDGMGGHPAGDVASKLIVEHLPGLLKQRLSKTPKPQEAERVDLISESVIALNQQLRSESIDRFGITGMGATVVFTLLYAENAYIGHLGDSRAYLFRTSSLMALTHDHSVIQYLLDVGVIRPEEAIFHPARGQITHYVGMEGDASPVVSRLVPTPGDRLLLCSDGLTNMLPETEIAVLLASYVSPESACQALVEAANEAGGEDNITVIVADWRAHAGSTRPADS
jgi:serine/threonine protein phosphatase PrpC